ncbi:ArsS family sensor histidine kinase [Sulfurospirillum sp. 1307]|jgi:two-component system OmpR family sensor kinase
MSIFTKVSTLFLISIVLMLYLSNTTAKLTDEKIEFIHKEKYIQASRELFDYLVNGDITGLKKRAKEFYYDEIKLTNDFRNKRKVYEKDISFGKIIIYEKDNVYFLYMKYFDDEFVFYDTSQNEELKKKALLNYLIIADILLLVVIFAFVIKMLIPLKNIALAMDKFGSGDYSFRLHKSNSEDEISKVTEQFNKMAENLETLITSRTQLLHDISHELKTPISKAILSLELIGESKYKKILKKSISQIDLLTNELLDIEKFNSKHFSLNIQVYSIDTILFEALSKMLIDDEKDIDVEIIEVFTCYADLNYLSIAIKNLIDNAMKYKTNGKVKIVIEKNCIEVKNQGEALQKELSYYLEIFTQEDKSRNIKGHGLGLNLVKRILDYHGFKLKYRYEEGYNIFSILV